MQHRTRRIRGEDQKIAKALFCPREIVLGIDVPKNVVVRHLPVKRGRQRPEPLFSNRRIDFLLLHQADASAGAAA